MRNYYLSITVHVIFLLFLVFPFLTENSKNLIVEKAIVIDFRDFDSKNTTEVKSQPNLNKANTRLPAQNKNSKSKKISPKSILKTADPAPKSKKKVRSLKSGLSLGDKKKKKEESIQQETERQLLNKKKQEVATEKRNAINKKRSYFKGLISRSQDKSAGPSSGQPDKESKIDSHSRIAESSAISGSLGTRKVLATPQIKDNSQKQGRVVIKICVNNDGKVISSEYTQMGSTTSDAYLINLAESGAREYLFSKSMKPRECGKVFIDFELK